MLSHRSKLLEDAHARVRETLTRQRDVLESLATLLMEHEVVDLSTLTWLLAPPVSEDVPSAPVPVKGAHRDSLSREGS
jgi:ATP-dependent Zn protease